VFPIIVTSLDSTDNKHGRHRQLLFLIGRFFKIFSETVWPNESKLGRFSIKIAHLVSIRGRQVMAKAHFAFGKVS
jgi:hypothetical protein